MSKLSLKDYLLSIRPNLFITSSVCWLLGISYAYYNGYFNSFNAIISLIVTIIFHASVNAFNEVFDFLRGNDSIESLSEYSGGGGYLVKGIITPFQMSTFAIIIFIIALIISIYFVYFYPVTAIIGLIGVAMILLYTPILKPVGLGEIAMIIGFGIVTLGSYIVMFPPDIVRNLGLNIINYKIILVSLIAGLWKSSVLLINEFPDYENDKRVNTLNWVVRFGRKGAAFILAIEITLIFLLIIIAVLTNIFLFWAITSLLFLPIFINNIIASFNYENLSKHIKYMNMQVVGGYFLLGTISIVLFILK